MKTKKKIHIKRRLLKRRNTKKQNKLGGSYDKYNTNGRKYTYEERENLTIFKYKAKNKNKTEIEEEFGYNVTPDNNNSIKFNFYRISKKDEYNDPNNQEDMIKIGTIKFHVLNENIIKLGWVEIFIGKFIRANPDNSIHYQGRGYGIAMLVAFEHYIKSNNEYENINTLQLVPLGYTGNPNKKIKLCDFYEKSGYSQIEDGKPMYQKIIRS